MPVIEICCFIEKLFPYCTDQVWYFAVNFMVSVQGANQSFTLDTVKRMEPWYWDSIQSLTVIVLVPGVQPGDAVPSTTSGGLVVPVTPLPISDFDLVRQSYENLVKRLAFDANGNVQTGFTEYAGTINYGNHRKLNTITSDLATRPAPLQQALNLSRYFSIPADQRAIGIYAAPNVGIPGVTSGEVAPVTPTTYRASIPPLMWPYPGSLPAPDLTSVQAIVAAINPNDPAPPWLHNQDYFIQPPDTWQYLPDPAWASKLRTAIAQRVDVAAILLAAVQRAVQRRDAEFTRDGFLNVFRAALLLGVPCPSDADLVQAVRAPGALGIVASTFDRRTAKKPGASVPQPDQAVGLTVDIVSILQAQYALARKPSLWPAVSEDLRAALNIPAGPGVLSIQDRDFQNVFQGVMAAGNRLDQQTARTNLQSGADALARTLVQQIVTLAGISVADRAALTQAVQVFQGSLNTQSKALPSTVAAGPVMIPPFTPSSVAHPFRVPVGSPSVLNSRDAAKLSGYGLMVRTANFAGLNPPSVCNRPYTPWRCATEGSVYYLPPDEAAQAIAAALSGKAPTNLSPSAAPTVSAAVLPARPDRGSADAQQTMTYNAAPITANSALGGLATAHQPQPSGATVTDQLLLLPPILSYHGLDPAASNTGPEGWGNHSPALKFGHIVQGAVMAVPNSGALPKALSDGSSPGKLKNFDPNLTIPADVIYSELYLRRVPIGAPEIFAPSPAAAKQPGFDAASGIEPLERELDWDVLFGDNAFHLYFSDRADRANTDGSMPASIGTLELTQDGFSIVIERISLPNSGTPTMTVELEYLAGEQAQALLSVDLSGYRFFDFRLDAKKDGSGLKVNALMLERSKLIARSFTGNTRPVPVPNIPWPNNGGNPSAPLPSIGARIRIAGVSASVISYRRPKVQTPSLDNNSNSNNSRLDADVGSVAQAGTSNLSPLPDSVRPAYYLLANTADFVATPNPNSWVPDQYTFQVRWPATDIFTWDRWKDWSDPSTRPNRKEAWKCFVVSSKPPNIPAAFDDPAVANIYIEAVPVYPAMGSAAGSGLAPLPAALSPFGRNDRGFQITLIVNNSATGPRLNVTGAEATLAVKDNVTDAGAPPPAKDNVTGVGAPPAVKENVTGAGATLAVKDGEIWELRFYSAVPQFDFYSDANPTGKLHNGLTTDQRTVTVGGQSVVLFGPTVIRVEAAAKVAQTVIDPSQLTRSGVIAPAFQDQQQAGSELQVLFNRQALLDSGVLKPVDADAFQAYITDASLLVQEWRWMGRPFQKPFPFGTLTNATELANWENSGGFNGRRDEDVRVIRARLGMYDDTPQVWYEDVSSDPRALYHRYRILLYDRYRALLKSPGPAFSGTTDWTREYVPCRQTQVPPKPRVRLVVPLTQAAEWGPSDSGVPLPSDPQGSPGILVFATERWYGFGGLNEYLDVEAVNTSDEPLREADNLSEFGYNPLVAADPIASLVEFDRSATIGPIGHTVDLNTDAPLFQACSFIIPRPKVSDGTALKPGVPTMALVRFRRLLDQRGMAPGLNGRSVIPSADVVSEFTHPTLVHFLPDPGHVLGDADPTTLYVEATPTTVTLKRPGGDPVKLYPAYSSKIWIILNQRVYDAFGQQQERFLAIYEMDKDHDTGTLIWPATLDPLDGSPIGPDHVARLVEVQFSPKDASRPAQLNLWSRLFNYSPDPSTPVGADDDTSLRILPITYGLRAIPAGAAQRVAAAR